MNKSKAICSPDMLRGNTDILLLSIIDQFGTSYGYQIIKNIEKRSLGFFHFREGTIYPALRKLENEGYTTGEWQILPNSQRRRYYRITARGKELLLKKTSTWQDFAAAVNMILKPA
jgi:PadR family transcriptional regulator PadR